ncbi:winged helix DNA-binding domain-containing protein [Oerskovia sp. NPDC056781]|uniref:winged helix DNA-binding domain-containing protein n=1 Tax=Oerskovia sp. NPDC056781 TaxID=3345942 RepID=UPI003670BB81
MAGAGSPDAATVVATRLAAHHLRGAGLASVRDVVGQLGAVQSQEFHPSLWGIAQRTEGTPSAASVRDDFSAGAFLRTHVLRPTWHHVLPDDARWLLRLTAPRVHRLNRPYYPDLGGPAHDAAATDLLAEAVAEGNHRTRAELAALLADRGLPSNGLAFTYIVMRAELDGVLVSGVLRGRQQTYAAFDERVPAGFGPLGATYDDDAALVELLRRYLRSRGLATVKDFAGWSGLTLTRTREGLALLGADVEQVAGAGDAEGLSFWRLVDGPPSAAQGASERVEQVDLLQGYDEYFVSYKDSRDLARDPLSAEAPAVLPLRLPGKEVSPFLHVIAVDGRVVGRWRHALTARTLRLDTQLFRPLTRAEQQGLDAQAERLAAHWALSLERDAR